jgi:hypothetical protein
MPIAYGAGFFEGQTTALRIEQSAVNSGIPSFSMTPALTEFVNSNTDFARSMSQIAESLPTSHPDRRIMYHVTLVDTQLEGMFEGHVFSLVTSIT